MYTKCKYTHTRLIPKFIFLKNETSHAILLFSIFDQWNLPGHISTTNFLSRCIYTLYTHTPSARVPDRSQNSFSSRNESSRAISYHSQRSSSFDPWNLSNPVSTVTHRPPCTYTRCTTSNTRGNDYVSLSNRGFDVATEKRSRNNARDAKTLKSIWCRSYIR